MGAYVLFQFTTLKKKVGPYVILALSIILVGVLAIITSKVANNDGTTALHEISTFTKFFPFLFAVLFAAFVVAHIFKEGESDGSELITVAKPLSRKQIVFGKFVLTLAYIAVYQVIMLVAYIIFTQFDTFATSSEKLKWAASLFVGGLIVQIIAAAIIVMLASVLGKVGTIVISVLIAAVLPILSYILVPLGKGWGAGSIEGGGTIENKYSINYDSKDDQYITKDADSLYRVVRDENQLKTSYEDKRWYDNVAYFDVWYHWGRFYSIFMPTAANSTSIVKWVPAQGDFYKDKSTFTVGSHKYILLSSQYGSQKQVDETNNKITTMASKYKSIINGLDHATKDSYNNASFIQRARYLANNHDTSALTSDERAEWIDSTDLAAQLIAEKQNSSITPATSLLSSAISADKAKEIMTTLSSLQQVDGNVPMVVKSKDYIPTYAVIIVWSIIGLGMCAGALAIYSKRDFK